MSTCEFCGGQGPTAPVEFRQNTGMIVMRQSRTWAGDACRDCGSKIFWKATTHTLFLGWWGTISLFLTPAFIVMNIMNVLKTRSLQSLPAASRATLDDHRDYALNLIATKDRATVVDVLAQQTRAPRAEVEAFVDRLSAERAAS